MRSSASAIGWWRLARARAMCPRPARPRPIIRCWAPWSRLADGEGWLFTGRLSLETHPWLADHAVMGTVLLPGTAFVELALHAGREVDCGHVQELTLQAPLLLPEQGAVQLQVSLGEPNEAGQRAIAVYSRPEPSSGEDLFAEEQAWVCHAAGTLAVEGDGGEQVALEAQRASVREHAASLADSAWPPPGAAAIGIENLYERLSERGYDYGPAFQGLRAAWRLGEELFAEVALPEDVAMHAAHFGVHPALLDAALHALLAAPEGDIEKRHEGDDEQAGPPGGMAQLPFSWSGVGLHAAGASSLRVRITPTGSDSVSIVVVDGGGTLVASVRSLVSRPVSAEQLGDAHGDGLRTLFGVDWVPLGATPTSLLGTAGGWDVVSDEHAGLAAALAELGIDARVHPDVGSLGEAVQEGRRHPTSCWWTASGRRRMVPMGIWSRRRTRAFTACSRSCRNGSPTSASQVRGWRWLHAAP